MNKLDYVLDALETKYGSIDFCHADEEGCPHFLYDKDCEWGCKGNAMGN